MTVGIHCTVTTMKIMSSKFSYIKIYLLHKLNIAILIIKIKSTLDNCVRVFLILVVR